MVDFDGRNYAETATLLAAIERQSTHWSPDAIVRVRLASYPDKQLRQALSGIVAGPLNLSCPVGRQ